MIKNKKAVIMIGAILLISVLVVLLAVYLPHPTEGDGESSSIKVKLYYLNATANKLEPEERVIPSPKSDTELIENILKELKLGPKSKNLTGTLPEGVGIVRGTIVDNSVCELEISPEYKQMDIKDELFCRASLVWTLTEFDFIDNVHIYVGSEELLKMNNTPMGLLNRDNMIINPRISVYNDTQVLTLYFSDGKAQGLVKEERVVEVDPNKPIERYIIEQIIAGPSHKGNLPTVPVETKLKEVKIDGDICMVDLTIEFVTKHSGGSASDRLTIYSIVNSLTELSKNNRVQILVDSEKVTDFKGSFDLSKPLERDESVILK